MRTCALPCALVWALAALSLAAPTRAQPATPAASGAQQADELFASGVEAMKLRDWAAACPAIAQSYRLDPLPGALFTLAECRARAGKVASATRDFERYLELTASLPDDQRAQQQERIPVAERRRRELDARVPRLTIEAPADLPSDVLVELDGAALSRQQLGVPLALDPGPHRLLVRVAGRESDIRITLAEGELRRIRLAVPRERELAPAPAATPAIPTAIPPPRVSTGDTATDDVAPSGLLIAGWTSVAVGAVGLVVAATAGLVLLGKKDTIDANCSGTACNDVGLAEAEDVPTLDTLGTSAFVVGGVLTTAGLVMLLVDSTQQPSATGWHLVVGHDHADAGATLQLRW
jgi:hypothetical protein